MSVICSICTHEGIVLATDSRETINKDLGVHIDTTTKLFELKKMNFGVAACGDTGIDGKRVYAFLESFENEILLSEQRIIETVADKLSWELSNAKVSDSTALLLGGFSNNKPYVYRVDNTKATLLRDSINIEGVYACKLPPEICNKVSDTTTLASAIALAKVIIEATIDFDETCNNTKATCGGDIDILVIKEKWMRFFAKKDIDTDFILFGKE